MTLVLGLCAAAAVIAPLLSRRVEEQYPLFLLVIGATAATLSWAFTESLVVESLLRPLQLCLALLGGALFFSLASRPMGQAASALSRRLGPRLGAAASIVVAAAMAPFLTGAVAALVLVELLKAVPMGSARRKEVAVIGVSAVGLAAGLSATGSPAAAVLLANLSNAPAAAITPWYLFDLVGPWVLAGAFGLAAAGAALAGDGSGAEPATEDPLALWTVVVLTGRLFASLCGLILLGAGVMPALEGVLRGFPAGGLYWVNAVSAVLDNAALAAVEFEPGMLQDQIRFAYCGILAADPLFIIAGAPNLVAADRLGISPREWASVGIPVGAALYIGCFLSLVATAS